MRAHTNVPPHAGIRASRLAAAALCALSLAAAPGVVAAAAPDDGSRGRDLFLGGDAYRGPSDVPWTLDLTPDGRIDAATLDARGRGLRGAPASGRLVARDVLAGLLAWEAGRGLGDGAHVRPVVAVSRPAGLATAAEGGPPALGAAVAPGAVLERRERYHHDVLDLSLEGPPTLPDDVVIDDVPGLSFERRTIYQATTGRLFVDVRLRHRDPAHGDEALEDEARTAAALARMRALSTLVLEPVRRTSPNTF